MDAHVRQSPSPPATDQVYFCALLIRTQTQNTSSQVHGDFSRGGQGAGTRPPPWENTLLCLREQRVAPRETSGGLGKGVMGPARQEHTRDVLKHGAQPARSPPRWEDSVTRRVPFSNSRRPQSGETQPDSGPSCWGVWRPQIGQGQGCGAGAPGGDRVRAPTGPPTKLRHWQETLVYTQV